MKKKLFIRKNSKMNYYSKETSVSNTHFPSYQVSLTTHEKYSFTLYPILKSRSNNLDLKDMRDNQCLTLYLDKLIIFLIYNLLYTPYSFTLTSS